MYVQTHRFKSDRLRIATSHSTLLLPVFATGFTLKRAHQIGSDPTAIKASGLWLHRRAIHTAVQRCWVKRHTVGQFFCTSQRLWITPSHSLQLAIGIHKIPVLCGALPFTKRTSTSRLQKTCVHITPWQVHAWWMRCLKDAYYAAGSGHLHPAPAYNDFPGVVCQPWRTREIPDRHLPWPWSLRKCGTSLALPMPLFPRIANPLR